MTHYRNRAVALAAFLLLGATAVSATAAEAPAGGPGQNAAPGAAMTPERPAQLGTVGHNLFYRFAGDDDLISRIEFGTMQESVLVPARSEDNLFKAAHGVLHEARFEDVDGDDSGWISRWEMIDFLQQGLMLGKKPPLPSPAGTDELTL